MNDAPKPTVPLSARIARVVAIAAWPVGIVVGLALAAGQDAAGEGIAFAFGLLIALAVSALSTGVYFFAKSEARVRAVRRHGSKIVAGLAIAVVALLTGYLKPLLVEQRFSADIENRMSQDLSNVEISVANLAIEIAGLEANETVVRKNLVSRPSGPVTVRWINADNEAVVVTDQMTGGPPRRFDGGTLVVNILAEHQIHAYFLPAAMQ